MAIKGSRSGLYWRTIPGGLPSIVDVTKIAGDIYFVDSTASGKSDTAGHGYHPDKPFATIDFAVGQCTANQGDHIFVMPGHVETVAAAAGLDLDVAGITIVFAGYGNARGYVNFTTAVGADMDVDAADITLINPRFVAGVDALTGPIDINAARFAMIGGGPGGRVTCQDGTAINTTDWIVGDANADDALIEDIEFIDGDGAGTQKQSFIQFAAATRPALRRVRATGDFGTGVIENGTAWIDALLDDIVVENTAAGPVVGILLQATSSGTARKVHVRVASGTTYVTANNDMQWFECYGVGTDAAAGDHIGDTPTASIEGKIDTLQAELSGAAGLTTFPTGAAAANAVSLAEVIRYIQENIIVGTGTALPANQSLYDVLAGANGIATWAAAAAPANGVSIAEVLRDTWDALRNGTGGTEPGTNKSIIDALGFDGAAAVASSAGMLRVMAGTTFVVKKTLTSSAVVQAGVDVTAVSTVGDIQIIDVTLQADGTGLAAGTNFTLECNNAKGSAVFLSTAVSGLGASALMDLDSASVTSKTVVLETGKKVVAKCTVADCTGAGTVDVYLICRRLADGAALTAA